MAASLFLVGVPNISLGAGLFLSARLLQGLILLLEELVVVERMVVLVGLSGWWIWRIPTTFLIFRAEAAVGALLSI